MSVTFKLPRSSEITQHWMCNERSSDIDFNSWHLCQTVNVTKIALSEHGLSSYLVTSGQLTSMLRQTEKTLQSEKKKTTSVLHWKRNVLKGPFGDLLRLLSVNSSDNSYISVCSLSKYICTYMRSRSRCMLYSYQQLRENCLHQGWRPIADQDPIRLLCWCDSPPPHSLDCFVGVVLPPPRVIISI